MDKIAIKFKQPFQPYKAGDITAKPADEAEEYVKSGKAEYLVKKVEPVTEEIVAPKVDKKIKKPRVKK